ncbi:hypothetical protein M409DRAFT_29506 [Zasmidium cellare ATCC 36951]|uniref:Uncharacterized protein n=1 Tax=Zasmidium cellare ATCC 36951 TaxID=1080233 RepID=A0A6A6C3T6_ZASCE|nr:uncharacterized protein M409DRAFT_29506 [Zasmidium cellare ATCC 36951]KAF2160056.1 hypothetical protein M409DRAFT_29506 [Zasmidium cellare ATCC 36951]
MDLSQGPSLQHFQLGSSFTPENQMSTIPLPISPHDPGQLPSTVCDDNAGASTVSDLSLPYPSRTCAQHHSANLSYAAEGADGAELPEEIDEIWRKLFEEEGIMDTPTPSFRCPRGPERDVMVAQHAAGGDTSASPTYQHRRHRPARNHHEASTIAGPSPRTSPPAPQRAFAAPAPSVARSTSIRASNQRFRTLLRQQADPSPPAFSRAPVHNNSAPSALSISLLLPKPASPPYHELGFPDARAASSWTGRAQHQQGFVVRRSVKSMPLPQPELAGAVVRSCAVEGPGGRYEAEDVFFGVGDDGVGGRR